MERMDYKDKGVSDMHELTSLLDSEAYKELVE